MSHFSVLVCITGHFLTENRKCGNKVAKEMKMLFLARNCSNDLRSAIPLPLGLVAVVLASGGIAEQNRDLDSIGAIADQN